jgi:hypothetical protein
VHDKEERQGSRNEITPIDYRKSGGQCGSSIDPRSISDIYVESLNTDHTDGQIR